MLNSQKIQRRQSEIRQQLAELSGKETPDETEVRQMGELDTEYRSNETRYRAALIGEDDERRDAGKELETREAGEWDKLIQNFELRQAALLLDEGRELEGATAEVVQELRGQGGYRGVPIPYEVLEVRAGETIASGVPDPVNTKPIIDRLLPGSVASSMGARMINIASGSNEYPVCTSSVSAGWASSETGNVAGPTVYTASGNTLKPDNTLGIAMKATRKALKQEAGLEAAMRRDMQGTTQAEFDKAVFLGSGASGQPKGVISKASGTGGYGITSTAIDAAATYAAFRTAIVSFMKANAATGPGAVRVLVRPEVFDGMDDTAWDAGSGITEWDRLVAKVGSVVMSSNALAAPTGTTPASTALLTTTAGVEPIFIATWGAIDLIRDPYSDAASGGLRLTALITMDVTISRAAQLQVLTGLQ